MLGTTFFQPLPMVSRADSFLGTTKPAWTRRRRLPFPVLESVHVTCPLAVLDDVAIHDRRLHRAECGEHPHDRARPGVRIFRQEAGMALRDMEDDRPRLEQGETVFFIGRNLPEQMKR